jgi:hypothetical protein
MGERCSTPEKYEKCTQYLVAKLEGKRPFGRSRHTYKGNSEMDFKRIYCVSEDWIYVYYNRGQ